MRLRALSIVFFALGTVVGIVRAAQLDDPTVPAGYVVVDSKNPAWFKYNGGGPVFICGAGDPEDYLYRGTRNADGTRSGDQMAIIDKMVGTGANCLYVVAFRSKNYGGDGDPDNNPFINSDITKTLDEDILNQWETWFTHADANGIIIYFVIYDDELYADGDMGWQLVNGELCAKERYFVSTLVGRFKHHKNLVWSVQEGSNKVIAGGYKANYTRFKKLGELIRQTDNYHHPISIVENDDLAFSNFAADANYDQLAIIYYTADTPAKLSTVMKEAWGYSQGRYNLMFIEALKYGYGSTMHKNNWAVAMGGAYPLVYLMFVKGLSTLDADLRDCGILANFFQATDVHTMIPHDELINGSTKHVLANPGVSYIAYSDNAVSSMGIKGLQAGEYDLVWMDCVTGTKIKESGKMLASGNQNLEKHVDIGNEAVLHLRKK